jgi:hypothetical protein
MISGSTPLLYPSCERVDFALRQFRRGRHLYLALVPHGLQQAAGIGGARRYEFLGQMHPVTRGQFNPFIFTLSLWRVPQRANKIGANFDSKNSICGGVAGHAKSGSRARLWRRVSDANLRDIIFSSSPPFDLDGFSQLVHDAPPAWLNLLRYLAQIRSFVERRLIVV